MQKSNHERVIADRTQFQKVNTGPVRAAPKKSNTNQLNILYVLPEED